MLRIIQNNENRREIYKEGKRFNLTSSSDYNDQIDQEDSSMAIEEQDNELDTKFDPKMWHDFLNDLSIKIADCFLNTAVETEIIA